MVSCLDFQPKAVTYDRAKVHCNETVALGGLWAWPNACLVLHGSTLGLPIFLQSFSIACLTHLGPAIPCFLGQAERMGSCPQSKNVRREGSKTTLFHRNLEPASCLKRSGHLLGAAALPSERSKADSLRIFSRV